MFHLHENSPHARDQGDNLQRRSPGRHTLYWSRMRLRQRKERGAQSSGDVSCIDQQSYINGSFKYGGFYFIIILLFLAEAHAYRLVDACED